MTTQIPQSSPTLLDAPPRTRIARWIVICLLFCLLAVIAYLTVDRWLVGWIHSQGIDAFMKKHLWWLRKKAFVLTWPGHFACTIVIAVIVTLARKPDWRPAALVLLSGALSGTNSLFKWIFGRSRPSFAEGTASMDFDFFRGGFAALFNQKNLAFPSGDTALAAATAACLTFLLPRGFVLWWTLAAIVALQRLAESAHHASDVLAAIALGIVAFEIAKKICLPHEARTME